MRKIISVLFILFSIVNGHTQVRLPQIIRDSMILQRDETVKLWGWASANERVNIRFNGKSYKTTADKDGNWMMPLHATKAGGPYTITITAINKITIRNILFGDIWFCSGQSNMVHQMNIHDVTYAKDIAEAHYPEIRQFLVPATANLQSPEKNLTSAYWKPAVGDNVRPFSAVSYFFAKKLYEKYGIPIGIINASVGGTPIEAWTSEQGLHDFTPVVNTIEKNKDTAYVNSLIRNASANSTMVSQPEDKGITDAIKWYELNYIPKGWRRINIPGYWEDQGIKDLNGVVWYRREIEIPATMAGKAATVFLGRITDADELYINGRLVGRTTYQYPQRRYKIPVDLLKAGKNSFVIRVTNFNGKGGFVPDKPYCIFSGVDTVDLKGYWQYKVGTAFRPLSTENSAGINVQNQPTACYNAMVAPEINYSIKGFCWYQGESNAGQPQLYEKLLPALIYDWRMKWKNDSLPFLCVQLPGFMDYNYLPSESNWALLRETQLRSLSIPNTGLAVTIDLGEWNDIHPDNKKDVGERLALAAMKIAYKEKIVYSGPLYKSSALEGTKIILRFSQVGGGLLTIDHEMPSEFAIAGADKKFVWAETRIEGNTIVVWSDEIKDPKYVRYAWADNPVHPNLFNKEGLPASPFRTDQ